MKIPIERIEARETSDFVQAAEHVLQKNQELYERLGTEHEIPPHASDLDDAERAFSEVRRQYRETLKKLAE